jgi:cell division protein FtsI/penicillin-binding protein 2
MKWRVPLIIITVLILAFVGLIYRLIDLQYLSREEYSEQSRKQRRAIINLQPQRGMITDRTGRLMAASSEKQVLYAEPRIIKDMRDAANALGEVLEYPAHRICIEVSKSKNPGYAKIMDGLTLDQCDAVRKARIYGIGIHQAWERSYPMGRTASHIVGFTSRDQIGQNGIELEYNEQLKGKMGRDVFVVDAIGRPIAMIDSQDETKRVADGFGIILTIDSTIQEFTRAALAAQVKKFEAESGVAIVMDPWTGQILALVSLPDFEPLESSKTPASVLRNRALTDPFEPGSIYKPIVTALALDAGSIGFNDVIYCEKGNYHGKGFGRIGEWGGHKFGNMSIKKILVESSNVGMAKIGQKMGKKKLHDGIRLFGFGQKTGIDIPGEDSGVVRPLKKWDGYSVTRVPFGHEVTTTVIQIAKAYSILANGGSLITPHVVQAVFDSQGQIKKYPHPTTLSSHIIKPEVANWIVREALVAVVEEGTGKSADLEKWQVFGKTGTADIANAGYGSKYYNSSFAGGAPAEKPRVVVVVSVRKPNKSLGIGYTGGRVAAPVVGEILQKTLTYLEKN